MIGSAVCDWLKFLLAAAIVVLVLARGTGRLGYNWQFYRVGRYLLTWQDGVFSAGPLLKGLLVTLEISAMGLLLAFACGLITALLRLSPSYSGRLAARAYLEMVRNTPLLIQLFLIYFVAAPIFGLSAFAAAVLALSLFEGAYASEIIRAGIVGVDRGQWEASYSLGLNRLSTYRHVVLPQALRRVLPPLTGQAIALIKDSALVSTIAIYDLTMQAQAIVADTFLTFEIWFTVAAIYLGLTLSLSVLVHGLEERMRTAY